MKFRADLELGQNLARIKDLIWLICTNAVPLQNTGTLLKDTMKKKEESPMVKKATHSKRKKRLSEPFKGSSETKNIHGFPGQVRVGCCPQPRLHLTGLSHSHYKKCVCKGGKTGRSSSIFLSRSFLLNV